MSAKIHFIRYQFGFYISETLKGEVLENVKSTDEAKNEFATLCLFCSQVCMSQMNKADPSPSQVKTFAKLKNASTVCSCT